MGQQDVRVGLSDLRATADTFDRISEIVGRSSRTVTRFGAACAGRAHIGDGDTLHRALEAHVGDLAQWSRAAAEIAATLRSGAERYAHVDRLTATDLR